MREGLLAPLEPVEGIPDFLWWHLENWVEETLFNYLSWNREEPVLYALRFGLEVAALAGPHDVADAVVDRTQKDHEFAWDVVDDLVAREGDHNGLGEVLDVVAHEFQVTSDGTSLTRRVPDEVDIALKEAASSPDHALELLLSAFAKVFGRNPEARNGWEDATKTVENLLKPIVSPKDQSATLSKMAQALRDKPEKWVSRLRAGEGEASVLAFARTLDLVGYAPGRHGGEEAVDLTTARSAVVQAITVVQRMRDGVLERRQVAKTAARDKSPLNGRGQLHQQLRAEVEPSRGGRCVIRNYGVRQFQRPLLGFFRVSAGSLLDVSRSGRRLDTTN